MRYEKFTTADAQLGCINVEKDDITLQNPNIIPPDRKSGEKIFTGGVLDANGREIETSRMWRIARGKNYNMLSVKFKPKSFNGFKKIEGDYTYIGGLYDHYGHFLIESLSRIPLDRKDKQFIHLELTGKAKMPDYANYFLKALNISSKPIKEYTSIIGNVEIPYPRIVMGSHFNKSQMEIYRDIKQYALRKQIKHEKDGMLYLSRSKLHVDKRRVLNELELEKRLERLGFEIVHMQELPVEEQIIKISKAKIVVGFIGSAMHSLVFANPDTKVVMLYDGTIRLIESILNNYLLCDEMIGRVSTYIDTKPIATKYMNSSKVAIPQLMQVLRHELGL